MNKEELIQKLSNLECEDFEVKKAKRELPKSIWETVSAFANTTGGWVVLGVEEKGNEFIISGVENTEKLEQDFLNTLRGNKFNVFVPTKQDVISIEDKTILSFYIPVHNNKPVYYNTQSNTFIRRGSADQRATPEEIDSMLRDRSFGTKTTELAPNTNRFSLNEISVKRYRDYMTRFNPSASYNRYNEDEFLQKLRILEGDQCTYAGLLMLGKREILEKHFADFKIDLLEIPGTSYSSAKSRYTYRLEEQENLWEYYFECFQRLKQKVDVRFVLTAEGFGQELSAGLEAIREALVNMLMHTDYFSPASPRVRIFTDRIEFYNPGGLPKPFEELRSKDISLPRNPILAKLFRMVKLAENAGFGFDKMDYNWKEYNHTTPDYQIEFDSIVTKFFIEKVPEKTTEKTTEKSTEKTTEKIIRVIKGNSSVTIKEISEILDISYHTVDWNIRKLKKEGCIKRIGSDRKGYWKVVSKEDL